MCIFPRVFHNNSLCKTWGANRVHYGELENREFQFVFYYNINVKVNVFSERELKKALHDTLTRATWYGRQGPSSFLLVRFEHAHASYPGATLGPVSRTTR